ncbi:hypothetical protein ABEG18_22015 [Alsobacter sp. KACC 23698]|uniref:Uncharacterized protein n=1 Tax=Alsobacter sp. KACC 23698 TaxID=3149229 RepID=A0AAU7JDP9_9HYPH
MRALAVYPIYAKDRDGPVIPLGDVRAGSHEAASATALRFLRQRALGGGIRMDCIVWLMGPDQRPVLPPRRLDNLLEQLRHEEEELRERLQPVVDEPLPPDLLEGQ